MVTDVVLLRKLGGNEVKKMFAHFHLDSEEGKYHSVGR
jgi:hypothetical protein